MLTARFTGKGFRKGEKIRISFVVYDYVQRNMTSLSENNNREPSSKKHWVKPLLLAQNSLHVPSHVLLPRGSLFAHPYPESVHPFETHEQQSIGELTARTITGGNHLRQDKKASQQTEAGSKHGPQSAYKICGARDEKNTGGFAVKNIPVLPFKMAVFCLVLNIVVPGAGKSVKYNTRFTFKFAKERYN